jgi:hypothetical protein
MIIRGPELLGPEGFPFAPQRSLGDIFFELRGETEKLIADAKAGGTKAGDSAGKSFGDRFKAAMGGGSFGGFVKSGFGIGAGLAVFDIAQSALGGVIGAFGDAQQAASDLGEQQAKLDQVFDASADRITEWSEDSATAMGLSKRAAIEATGTLGNFLQAMGTAEGDSADMSMSIVQLSADIASFNNVAGGAEEVLDSMRAGLSGETEPLRRFGIDISDAAVQAELLAQGVKKVGGAYTQAQKIQGRYAIIMKQTAKAQGDFARTSDSSANQARTLDSLQENLNAKVGVFADQVVRAAQGLAIDLVGGIEDVMEAFGDLQRFLDPAGAEIEDMNTNIRAMAESWGVPADAVIAYLEAQRKAEEQTTRLAEIERELEYARLNGQANLITKLEREQEALLGIIQTEEEAGVATVAHADKAKAGIEEFLALSPEAQAEWVKLTDGASAAGEATEEAGDAAGGTVKAYDVLSSSAGNLYAQENAVYRAGRKHAAGLRDEAVAARELADGIDLAKGSFKSFWKTMREEQKRVQWFIRNPGKLRQELDHIEREIKRSEGQKQKLLADGFQKGDALALEAIDRRIRALRAKQDEYRALGTVWGNATEAGVESAFQPTLSVPNLGAEGAAAQRRRRREMGKKDKTRADGGPVRRGLAYIVGERGPEMFLPNVDGHVVDDRTTERALSQAQGGASTTVNLDVYGLPMRAETPREVVAELQRAARMGSIAPRRQTGWATP